MSLTTCIKELGSVLSAADKKAVVDATLRLRRTIKDPNEAAIQAVEAHRAALRGQLDRSEEIDRANPAAEGEAFEVVGMRRAPGKERWIVDGIKDKGGFKGMEHRVHAERKDGEYRVWQDAAPGQGTLEADSRTFKDLGKAEVYARQLAGQMRPKPEPGEKPAAEETQYDRIREQIEELGVELGLSRPIVAGQEYSVGGDLERDMEGGHRIRLYSLSDHVTKAPTFNITRSGPGYYQSEALPTQESARALLQDWIDQAEGRKPLIKSAGMNEGKARLLAQFPIGTHVKILNWSRLGNDNGKFAGRTGEVVDGHFDGWYVQLDPTLRERSVKKILVLANDGLEQVDKASIRPPRSKAEIEAERRETERTIFNDLVTHHVGGPLATMEVLEAEIRTRAGDVQLSEEQVSKLAKAIRKKASEKIQEAAKEQHRNPEVIGAAIAQHLTSAYADTSGVGPERREAFVVGFQHAMAGKTKSTLAGEHLADRQKGYAAAMRWRDTEEGAAWYEGRAVNKLQNTGVDLRRHWEALREQMKAEESDVKKAWRQIERATTRADLFAPLLAKPDATPGYKAYVEEVRNGTRPFKEWLQEVHTRFYGAYTARRGREKSSDGLTNLDYILDGSRYPNFLTTADDNDAVGGRARDIPDIAKRQRWETDPAFRADWLRGAAEIYLTEVREFMSFLEGSSNVQAAADAFTQRMVPENVLAKIRDEASKGRALTPSRHDLTPDGSRFLRQYWSGKDRNFLALVSSSLWTKDLIAKEATYQAPDKAKPLTPPRLDHIVRTGMPDQRRGENVTPQQFKETFGFADVGFGKWVGAQQDQDHLNYSFDAFLDLANFLKVDPKNIGFAGRLHFTIGALGHGKFAAHFQRAQPSPEGGTVQVINVTNTKGDGTVAHEWIHALDHNLGGQWKGRVRTLMLDMLRYQPLTPQSVEDEAKKFLFGGWFWRGDKKLSKVQAAARGIDWMRRSRNGETAYNKNALQLGAGYWGNDEELIARAGEAWVLDSLGGNNTYLVNPLWAGDGAVTKEKGYRGTPYPTGHERKAFAKIYDALMRAIKWNDGAPTVSYDDFRKELGEEPFEWEKRRDALNSPEAMMKFRDEVLEQQREARADKEAEIAAAAEQAAAQLEAADPAPVDEPAIVDVPGPEQVSGPLSPGELEDLFDQAAAELREERQEQPDLEPPPDAESEPEREPQAETRASPAAAYEAERQVAREIGDMVRRGIPVVFSGTEWASANGLPRIQDFPSDKVRHMGFGVFEFQSEQFEGNWTAGGAMSRGGPDGTSYTTVSVTKGEWESYPRQRVLDALEAFINRKAEAKAPPPPAKGDKGAGQLLAEAAKLGVKGADEALKGLAKLFGGGPGRLNSFGAGFDEETYQKAKPHFQAALTAFQEAGRTLKDLFKLLIAQYGDGIKEYAIRFAKDQNLTANLGQHTPAAEISPSMRMARTIASRLERDSGMDWRMLFELADNSFGGTQAEGKYTPKDAYDALEMGVNLFLQRGNGEAFSPAVDQAGAAARLQVLDRLMPMLPTQTKRTGEQMDMQQFSTVPPLAYMAAWVGNPSAADTVMEPSAGTGGLAVFAKNAGARLVLNELSSRRAAVLQELFPAARVWTENAEQLHNILPDEVRPTLVLMNPPFSNSAATNIRKDTMIGARHVEQALERLARGGRLVAIVGDGMRRGAPAFRDWWAAIDKKYHVRAAIPMDGSGYAKYGTTFDNVLLVIDKTAPPAEAAPLTTKVTKYSELIPLLTEIRDARPTANAPGNEREGIERDDAERARADALREGERDADAGAAADGPAVVGGGESPGTGGRRGNRSGRGGARDLEPDGGVRAPGGERADGLDDAGASSPPASTPAPAVTAAGEQRHTEAITASVFEPYHPQRLQIEGAKEHPGKLVQSAAMATVLPPAVDYTPNLPGKTITDGLVSIAQLEAVVYAGQAHREVLADGSRKGYFIGDGTGVGKGREISAVILDNFRQGRKKHVWVSEKQGLMVDAKRDFKGVGGNEDLIFNQNQTEAEGKIDAKQGILFTTYATLRSGANSQALNPKPLTDQALLKDFPAGSIVMVERTRGQPPEPFPLHADGFKIKENRVYLDFDGARRFVPTDRVVSIAGVAEWKFGKPKKKAGQSRLDQLVAWLGKDFDGVLVFDEAHNAGNAVAIKGERGFTDPSLQALTVVEIQKQLPQARVMYVSATGATQVSNLSYATRLGLWGPGTPFASVHEFINQMTAGGLATMELVARDMKQMGVYLARSLSYEGVTYSRVEHELTPAQRGIYNRLAEAWQVVLQNFEKALELTNADKSPMAKSAARSAFWSGQQRFFNQVITSMQMPSVLVDVEQELETGNAVVLQLVNTNEAAQERSLAKRKEGEEAAELEELDLTPRDQLLGMVEKAFPVNQYEEYRDEDGKKQVRQVVDSKGNPVQSKEAVALRDALLKDLQDISVPDGPLEQIINHFGPDRVAEITGRGRRVVAGRWNKKDKGKAFIETRGSSAIRADASAFMGDKKPILIFSDAGGTGFSFHADRGAKNQRKRIHYLVQPGWRADKAVQGFGRTHRTNEASEPHYKLVATDVPAHKRFLSAIARRLDQLGALTKGQRDTANQGLFSEKDNLEGIYAQQAVRQFLNDVMGGRGRGIEGSELLNKMGLLGILDPETGVLTDSKIPETRLFLNRMLSLDLELQAQVFEHFIRVMEEKVDIAVQRGEFDAGLQTIQALSAHVMRDEVVFTEPKSGAETRYVELELTQPTRIYSMPEGSKYRTVSYYRNARSGRVWAKTGDWERTDKDGTIKKLAQLAGTSGFQSVEDNNLGDAGWSKISKDEAHKLWADENAKRPKTYTERAHMIVGALLPIWDRLEGSTRIKVVRTQTDDGRRYLGRLIDNDDVKTVLKRLDVQSAASKMSPGQIMAAVLRGQEAELANGWKIKRAVVSGEPRIEIEAGYLAAPAMRELTGMGVIHEQIQWKDRLFVPTSKDGSTVLGKILKTRPVVELSGEAKKDDVAFARRPAAPARGFDAARRNMIAQAVEQMTASWKRKPRIHVIATMADAPAAALEEMGRQEGQNAAGETAGFLMGDEIYLVADQLGGRDEIRSVLYHEALGHYGLRGVWGDGLKPILQQLATMRPQLVAKKAKEYGLDMAKEEDRLLAAEEVLAELAQTRPELGWVQRAISYIRRMLRAAGLVKNLSDNDVIANYILPARGFVERGRAAAAATGPVAFSRGFTTREIQVDGKWRPIVDAAGRLLAGGDFAKQQAFWRWFSESKVVDGAGRPVPVYHGTDAAADFSKFRKAQYFAESAEDAELFGGEKFSQGAFMAPDGDPAAIGLRLMPVYLSIKTPLEVGGNFEDFAEHTAASIRRLRAQGYDGIHYTPADGRPGMWLAFDPEQIKSVTGNEGGYDPKNRDIRFARVNADVYAMPIAKARAEAAALAPRVQAAYESGNAALAERLDARLDALHRRLEDGLGELEEDVFVPDGERRRGAVRGDVDAEPDTDADAEADVLLDLANRYVDVTTPSSHYYLETDAERADVLRMVLEDYSFRHGGLRQDATDAQILETARDAAQTVAQRRRQRARPVFARTSTIGASRTYSPAQERAMRNVGFQVEQPTLAERAQELWKDAGKKLAQGIADQFRPIRELSSEAYALLRLARGASGAFETLLHGGRLKLTDGVYDFDAAARGGVLKQLLIPLQGEHHDFFRWIAANRAERLAREGKENLFTAQDIADLKTLAEGELQFDFTLQHGPKKGQVTRSRAEAYSDSLATFNQFNKNVLDLAEQSGLIDGESRNLWEHEFYVPFYRVSEDFDGGFRGANIKSGVVRQKAFEKLKGGKEKLNADLLDNTLLNWAHLLDAAAKNRAAKATLEAAQAAGIALEAKEDVARQIGRATGNRQGVVWFAEQGRERYFVVDDPYVLEALTSLEYAGMRNPVMDAMGAFKHWLTIGVTASPFFKIRNLIRDSVTVLGTSKINPNPLANLAQGWKDTDPKNDRYFQLLAGGGTIHFGTMLEGSEAKRVQALVESGIDRATILDSADKVKAFYRKVVEPAITAYNELGNRGEAVNRAALYDQLRKQGKSHAEASLEARDLMDFSMQGTWTSIRFLTQVVPFFNARIQGMYKLGRAAKEDPARFSAVVGSAALVSLALLAAYGDDDDWKRREEWDRDNFWWFKIGGVAFRIPKPFEIGAMATLAERSAELMFDDEMTGDRFRRAVLKLAGDQLSMNPIPQLIKPVIDVYANWDSFTERPIETMAMERLEPEYRFTERTSMVARGISGGMNAAAGTIGAQALSPVQVDHLLRGYFGWLGAFIVGAGDTVFRPATGQARQAAPDYWKSLTGGMVAELEGAPSRYVSQMYEQAKEIEQAYGTWRMLVQQGKTEEAAEYRADNQEALSKFRAVQRIKRQEGELNRRIREIERSDMDPVAKRERIQQIRDQQDRLARVLSPGASGQE